MKLFETSWREGYNFYERYYDTNLNKSVQQRIDLPYEWYEPNSNGIYSYILDSTIRLDKKQGNAKDGRDKYGFLDPLYRNIRDNYWNKDAFNLTPRTFYLDIETRVGHSYKSEGSEKLIKIKKKPYEMNEIEVSVNKLRDTFSKTNENINDYEYYDELSGTWENLSNNYYFQKNSGFPKPEQALEEISLMQFFDTTTKVMFVLGVRDWKHQNDYNYDYEVKYINCSDELNLIETFLTIFSKLNPLIIYAWNGSGFDFPYIYNRLKRLNIDTNRLSNYGEVKLSMNEFKGKMEFKFSSNGHHFIDLMDVYKKFVFSPRPSYSLDSIAEIELQENKVNHTEYAAFDDFYTGKYIIPENPTEEQKNSKIYQEAIKGNFDEVRELAHSEFVHYGIIDTYLIYKLDDKLKFTALMVMIAEKMGVTLGDSMGTVKPWSQYILNRSYLNKQVMPYKQQFSDPHIVGGFVKDPIKGKHNWLMSVDVNSMYPLLGMVGFNMSPETYIPINKLENNLKDYVLKYFNNQNENERFEIADNTWHNIKYLLNESNVSLGINGAVFSKDKLGMVPEMVQEIYKSRKQAKKTMFLYEQRKILIKEIIKRKEHELV